MRSLASLALLSLCSGCAVLFNDDVPRKVNGVTVVGPFISDEAYAAHLQGALARKAGDLSTAERAFERAASLDPKHPGPWVHLGALRCTRSAAEGDEAFSRAARIDPDFAPIHREKALCLAAARRPAEARVSALRALALDPSDPEPPLLLARLALDEGDEAEALRWLRSSLARSPVAPEAIAFALEQRGRPAFAPLALRFAPSPLDPSPDPASPPAPFSIAALDRALLSADLPRAQALARRARLAPGDLAARAAALGLRAVAREQALLVLGADPSSADARIALIATAQGPDDWERALSGLYGSYLSPSPVAALLLAEVLWRKAGPEAARAALRLAPPAPADDPLALEMKRRVDGMLAGGP